jgi:hypothetical protein
MGINRDSQSAKSFEKKNLSWGIRDMIFAPDNMSNATLDIVGDISEVKDWCV